MNTLITIGHLSDKEKIAGFDLDNTLIKTKSDRVFPEDIDDWEFNYGLDRTKKVLNDLIKKDYQIVIITNQNGIGKRITKDDIILKVKRIIDTLGIDIYCLIAPEKDFYRKPMTGTWKFIKKQCNIDIKESFYCGDAAGRINHYWSNNVIKSDFSCCDRLFAYNCRITFHTPEKIFLDTNPTDSWKYPTDITFEKGNKFKYSPSVSKKIMVLLTGFPGCGKSRLVKKFFVPKGYKVINQDELKIKKKCTTQASNYSKKFNVVIDNTNVDTKSRQDYIKIAKKYEMHIVCIVFDLNVEQSNHLNYYRTQKSKGKYTLVPVVVYRALAKKYRYPEKSEGIDDIIVYKPKIKKSITSYKFE